MVGVHYYISYRCACVCAQSLQSCLTLCDPMDCSPPGSSVHGICQARILVWASMPSSRESSWSTDWSWVSFVSCIAFFTHWAAGEAQVQLYNRVIHNFWRLYSIIVQSLSRVWLFATPCTVARQASLSFTNSQSLLKFMSIESVTPSNHLILCWPLLLLPSIFLSIRVFSNESALHIRWPKYWSFSFSSSSSNEYSGLISFRIDWFALAVQGTLKSFLQHPSSKASILWCSAFFMVQLTHTWLLEKPWLWLDRPLSAK